MFSSDLSGVNPATVNGMILYYRLMTKWSGLGDSTELSRMGLSQGLVRPVTPTGQTSASRGTPTCLMAKKERRVRRRDRPRELRARRLKCQAL
jgi:hypothetical protein